jgi:hypothetical protein
MNLEEYLAKIIKLAKKNNDDLEIILNDDTVRIEVIGSKGDDDVEWHLGKSLDEQPNKEELKSFLKKF